MATLIENSVIIITDNHAEKRAFLAKVGLHLFIHQSTVELFIACRSVIKNNQQDAKSSKIITVAIDIRVLTHRTVVCSATKLTSLVEAECQRWPNNTN